MDINLQYHSQKGEIDKLVKEIVVGLRQCDPISALKMAANKEMIGNLYLSLESALINKDGVVWYVEYIQSVFVSSGFILEKNLRTDEEYILTILTKIEELYKKSREFIGFWSKKNLASGEYEDGEIEYISESYLMHFVRGRRYQFQQFNYLSALLQPHSDEFRKVFGITIDKIIEGLKKLEKVLSLVLSQAFKEFVDKLVLYGETISTIQKHKNHPIWKSVNEAFGVELYDVSSITGWPDKFIDSLSFSIGESKGFLENKEFLGWPFLDLPVQKKPFIKINGVSYCFDYYILFDNIYRTVMKRLLSSSNLGKTFSSV